MSPEIKKYISIGLKLFSLGLVIAAGSFWAGANVDSRPRYRDEQTLVGGTIWSQILLPVGLMISSIVGEEIDVFIHGYFLFSGVILLFATGITLITYECKSIAQQRHEGTRRRSTFDEAGRKVKRIVSFTTEVQYDKIYLCIGILSVLAGFSTLADFIVLLL